MTITERYRFSDYAILITVVIGIFISVCFKWNYKEYPINFMDGDAKDYYSPLVSVFIKHDFTSQTANDWFVLKMSSGTINVHSIGVAILLLPFFLIAYFIANVFGFALDGYSLPFQVSVALAALLYAVIGLIYLKKLFRLNHIRDKTSALIILLVFLGTNLLNYALSEAGMSHVYSFALISVFMYHSCAYVYNKANKNLVWSSVIFGLILLVRPNNVFILLSVFMWFRSFAEAKDYVKMLFKNKMFYISVAITSLIVFMQSIVWMIQSDSFIHNTYKADGFYWFHPQIMKMLFGFDAGFFIYTPLCLLFLSGLAVVYKENRFSFYATGSLILILFYFFSCYWAYTYFDGLGIRVLVDYYALFAFLGAKLFNHFSDKDFAYGSLLVVALFLSYVNLIYNYQGNRNILARAGMTYDKWRYTFLKTGKEYQSVLGGSNELTPYSKHHPAASLDNEIKFEKPFYYDEKKDFGVNLQFDSLGFNSNRVNFKIDCNRKELFTNSSKEALICVAIKDAVSNQPKSYMQFKLNEAPALSCCEEKEYNYSANLVGNFKSNDKVSCYIWNANKEKFLINKFSVKVYNYNYDIN